MKNRILGGSVYFLTAFMAFFVVAVTVLILIYIAAGGSSTLSWEFLTASPKEGMTGGGIFPAIVGTVLLVLLMSVAGVPVGTITAIYLTEYAKKNSIFTRMIRFAVNTLAGVPSIVFGLFGLGFFIQFIGSGMDKIFAAGGIDVRWGQPNLLWSSLTMALLTLPVVIVSVEEALRSVPNELREGSLAVGATKWQTIRKIVLPNSATGILTGVILAIGRGAGEVAPILFTGAAYYLPQLPGSLSDQFMNLGYHVYIMSTQSTDVEATKGIQFATVLVLLFVTFSLNFLAVFLRYRLRSRKK
ncbi:MAG: phosphate ABC transporter permease PstA [Bacteroidota bacterium]